LGLEVLRKGETQKQKDGSENAAAKGGVSMELKNGAFACHEQRAGSEKNEKLPKRGEMRPCQSRRLHKIGGHQASRSRGMEKTGNGGE